MFIFWSRKWNPNWLHTFRVYPQPMMMLAFWEATARQDPSVASSTIFFDHQIYLQTCYTSVPLTEEETEFRSVRSFLREHSTRGVTQAAREQSLGSWVQLIPTAEEPCCYGRAGMLKQASPSTSLCGKELSSMIQASSGIFSCVMSYRD